jgi:hypothetical protein
MPIDKNEVRTIIFQIVQRWAGGSLTDTERGIIDEFLATEVQPLGRLELLQRMGTPSEILTWFLTFIRTRMLKRFCEVRAVPDDQFVCCPC